MTVKDFEPFFKELDNNSSVIQGLGKIGQGTEGEVPQPLTVRKFEHFSLAVL